jgi:hypothetical protein
MGLKFAGFGLSGFVAVALMSMLALWLGRPQAFAQLGSLLLASAVSDPLLYCDLHQGPHPLPLVVPRQAVLALCFATATSAGI